MILTGWCVRPTTTHEATRPMAATRSSSSGTVSLGVPCERPGPCRRPFKFTVTLARRMMRRRCAAHGLRSARTLSRAMPLLRCHLTPLLPQLLAPFRRHLTEAVEGLAHLALPFGRQRLEFLPALPQQLPLLRRHGTPLIESLLGAGALLRRHGYPALAALSQRLLPLRRQAIPLAMIALQELFLLRGERVPSPWAGGRRSGCRRRRGRRSLSEAGGNA